MVAKTKPERRIGQRVGAAAGVEIELVVEAGSWPAEHELAALARQAADAVLAALERRDATVSELSIVFTDDEHVRALNAAWRGKDKPTNVLSFPAFPEVQRGTLPPLLGDIVLAAETVAGEAAAQRKPLSHHITHLIVHGILHLIGYDHETDAEAEEMEQLERRILAGLDIPDPY